MAALNSEEQHTWGFSGFQAYTALRMMTGVETVNDKTVFVTLSLCYSDPYLSQD